MRMQRLVLFVVCLLLCAGAASAQVVPAFDELSRGTFQPVALASVQDLDFHALLDQLRDRQGIEAQAAEAFEAAPDLLLVPLVLPGEPETHLFLYYQVRTGQHYFLQIKDQLFSGPEMRLWSGGPAELVINASQAVLLPAPSESTFRLDVPELRFGEIAAAPAADQVTDNLACIGRALGLAITPTGLSNLLSSASCSAASTLSLALTAYSCLNPTPIGILACTVGVTKIISCGFAACSVSQPANCVNTITLGQRINGSWASECASSHRPQRLAKYYTFRLTATTSVQINVDSVFVDAYVFLLNGEGPNGTVIAQDNDTGLGRNAEIRRTLPAGIYTIEATTFESNRTGSFAVSVRRR